MHSHRIDSASCAWLAFLCLLLATPRNALALAQQPQPTVYHSGSRVAPSQDSDFRATLNNASVNRAKYITFARNGWSGHIIRWRYNDSSRPSSIVASSDIMVNHIQAAMEKWTTVCNVQFAYDGLTSSAASLVSGSRDGINVIAWNLLSGNTAGITYAHSSGSTMDEADMVLNYEFNPKLDSTLVHEVGHMLGLDHSDHNGTVMSGPNTSTYSNLAQLQADDVAGCRALYGAPSNLVAPFAMVSADVLVFPDTSVGSRSNSQSVTLRNAGNAALVIGAAQLASANFVVLSTTCGTGAIVAPGNTCQVALQFAPRTAGYLFDALSLSHNDPLAKTSVRLGGLATSAVGASSTREMVEFRYVPLDYYFITSRDSEKSLIDGVAGWSRTGKSFWVLANNDAGSSPINRFYFDQVAQNKLRGSHFYTLLPDEVAAVQSLNSTNQPAPGKPVNEGIDSYAYLPNSLGTCASNQVPVYRLFRGNARFPDDPNHRFTTELSTYNSFVALGWDGEGVKFCVPQ
jgi:hypothetical protein